MAKDPAADNPAAHESSLTRDTRTPWQWPDEETRYHVPGAAGRLIHLIDRGIAPFWSNPFLFAVLAGVAAWASIWGFTSFYGEQYGRVPAYAWPFVPDSPLSTSAWIVAALAIRAGWDRRGTLAGGWAFFCNWAAMMNAKVGVWTAFAILYYDDAFFTGERANDAFQWMLILAHLGMVVFATMLIRKQRALPMIGYVAILALGFTWDFMDYFFVHFFLPDSGIAIFPAGIPRDPDRIHVLAAVTMAMTVAATLYVALATRLRGRPSER